MQPRNILGAEELLELGQGSRPKPAARWVSVSKEEGALLIKTVEAIIGFARTYPIEFHAYCPTDRWQETLIKVGTWSHEIERQLKDGSQNVLVPADAVFHLVDLERCVSAARDVRLDSSKLAFMLSAGGAIATVIFGLPWIGVPAYLAGTAVLLGRPLIEATRTEPLDPYKPSLSGCESAAIGDHTDKKKILERVIVCRQTRPQVHHWGTVIPMPGNDESSLCIAKGRFRVRIEGWADDRIELVDGWEPTTSEECDVRKSIAVWEPSWAPPRLTAFGDIPPDSGHEETFWVEYTGPLTNGVRRMAGPFG